MNWYQGSGCVHGFTTGIISLSARNAECIPHESGYPTFGPPKSLPTDLPGPIVEQSPGISADSATDLSTVRAIAFILDQS